MGIVLWPLAKVFEAGARTRAYLYRSGRMPQARLGRPVISIGNLSAGGTGKTPFTIWLFEQLRARGLRPAVLTRGYRRPSRRQTLIVRAASSQEARMAGDEVQVMLRHGVAPIGVDAQRLRAGRLLESECSPDLFLLDDGFQHLELHRDLDIVLIDSLRPPWKDQPLPAGLLREPMAALTRAQFAVLTRVQQWTDYEYARARVKITAPRIEVLVARTRIELEHTAAAEQTGGEEGLGEGGPPATPLSFAFAGIGNPKAFFADLCLAGVKVIGRRAFRDHHRYSAADLRDLERRAADIGAAELVTTEKDAFNIRPDLRESLAMPLRVAGMRLEVDGAEKLLDTIEAIARRSE